jgi:hypothetical protein
MVLAMKHDKAFDPMRVLFFRADALVLQSLSRGPDPTTSVAVLLSLAQVCSRS